MSGWKIKEIDNLQLVSLEEFQVIQKKYPGLVPIIIHAKDVELTKTRYITRGQIPFRKFVEIVRQYCPGVTSHDPLFFTANGIFIPSQQQMDKIYNLHKKADGFLHINVCPEPKYPEVIIKVEAPIVNETYANRPPKTEELSTDMDKKGQSNECKSNEDQSNEDQSKDKSGENQSGEKTNEGQSNEDQSGEKTSEGQSKNKSNETESPNSDDSLP